MPTHRIQQATHDRPNQEFDVVITMPAHNEASGIASFLKEIQRSFADSRCQFIIVDDASTDGTSCVVESLDGLNVVVLANSPNLGHGPSTIRGLGAAVRAGSPFVIAVDGDGQFLGSDIRRVYELLTAGNLDVVEGVREGREDPVFRRLTSLSTRLLVASRCGVLPRDANTPLRAYRAATLADLLTVVWPDTLTPNLFISALARRRGLRVAEVEVRSLPRRGLSNESVTWKARFTAVPSRRFVRFCADATSQWIRRKV